MITVNTDVLELTINTRGGDVTGAGLPGKNLKSTEPFQLLETTPESIYQQRPTRRPDNPANGSASAVQRRERCVCTG